MHIDEFPMIEQECRSIEPEGMIFLWTKEFRSLGEFVGHDAESQLRAR